MALPNSKRRECRVVSLVIPGRPKLVAMRFVRVTVWAVFFLRLFPSQAVVLSLFPLFGGVVKGEKEIGAHLFDPW